MYLLLLLAVIALFQCLDALGPGELPEIPGVCYSDFQYSYWKYGAYVNQGLVFSSLYSLGL